VLLLMMLMLPNSVLLLLLLQTEVEGPSEELAATPVSATGTSSVRLTSPWPAVHPSPGPARTSSRS